MKAYYEQDGVTIYHGDCLDVMASLPVESIDLVLTSPPYNLGVSSSRSSGMAAQASLGHYTADSRLGQRGGAGRWKAVRRTGGLAYGYGAHDDAMPFPAYVEWQKGVLRACWRLLPITGAIYYNHKPRVLDAEVVLPLTYNPDLPIRQIVMWDRGGGINCAVTHYCSTHEWLMVLAKPAFRLRDKSASAVGDVWRVTPETNTPHPAPFPLALARRVLETTKPGVVLDPFAGWGTTLVAARMLGRAAIGIELSERFCELAAERLRQQVLPLSMTSEQARLFDAEVASRG